MKNLSVMIKPASSMCNLRCKYCFYADVSGRREVPSYGMMQPRTTRSILEHIFSGLAPGDSVSFAFQGGEPTLAGLDYFRHFVEEVERHRRGVQVRYALQTNALLLDEDWCAFLKARGFLVGVSLDGPAEFHDACRVDAAQRGTYQQVIAALALLRRHGVAFNVLITLTNTMARHPQKLWRFLQENRIQYVQFTPCLSPLEQGEGKDPYGLTPRRFCQFYQKLFALWLADWKKGVYTSVKLIDDLVNMLAYGRVTACGLNGFCAPQLVVEANGNVYPCDFYMLDEYCCGNLCEQSLREILEDPRMSRHRDTPRDRSLCKGCPYLRLCGGGCRRMQSAVCYGPGETTCWYRIFLDSVIKDLLQVARDVQAPGNALRRAPRNPSER